MSAAERSAPGQLLASRAHTAGLIVIVLALAVVGRFLIAHRSPTSLEEFGRLRIYSLGLAQEGLLLLYVLWGLRKRGVTTVRRTIDESALTLGRWGLYAVIAIGTAIVWGACAYALHLVIRPGKQDLRQKTAEPALSVANGAEGELQHHRSRVLADAGIADGVAPAAG
jgi:hypothetical protein